MLAARGKTSPECVTPIVFCTSIIHGHGAQEGSGEAAGPVGGGERDSDHAGARVLRTAEYGIECQAVRAVRRSRQERIFGCCCWVTSRASIRSAASVGGRLTA